MNRTAILLTAIGVVLAGGTLVALVWWSLADRFFPGAARSTGQGVRRRDEAEPAKPVVVKGFDDRPPDAA